eukprot:CAMPEP_0194184162 /NCGR_PEP_ID=MMETSP0154-20130528/36137_1 /TAXON_ID=1049557 /ORGANISM="Thalassiothrix antarctica, Strain L6-D1" /LENGTH=607 /DNA_ID=CAMNT_0038901613 /DNA_START=25 /DNA_END=1849 /DNA_ORIENTATION=+
MDINICESGASKEKDNINILLQSNNKAIKNFLDALDTIESTNPKEAASTVISAASLLVDAKTTQREIVNKLNTSSIARNDKRKELKRQNLMLENLLFEKKYLQSQLNICKACPTPNLERMSRDELNDKESANIEGILNKFLCGSTKMSFQDPKRSVSISEKLHKELNSRGTLKCELDKLQNDLKKRKRVVEQERAFLKDIPKKLSMIERSSVPLQKFFQSSTSTPTLHLIGSDRKKRLSLARTLSGPLYSLFVQFHAHFDSQREEFVSLEIAQYDKGGKRPGGGGKVIPDDQVVHLSFAIPDIFTSDTPTTIVKRKRVTIEFAFVKQYSLVTAKAIGPQEKITASTLLEEVFPNDLGKWIGRPDDNTIMPGKPYHWCNFISGIHIAHSILSDHNVHLSTKAVIREVGKRVNANAVLTQLIASFEKRKVIAHPSLKMKEMYPSDCGATLEGWILIKDEKSEKSYTVNIKRYSDSLSAYVVVDWCHYPKVLPKWSLSVGKEGWDKEHGLASNLIEGTDPLYSPSIRQIESIINSDMEFLLEWNDETCYNWVIAHQLIKLMTLWDRMLQNNGSNESLKPASTDGATDQGRGEIVLAPTFHEIPILSRKEL